MAQKIDELSVKTEKVFQQIDNPYHRFIYALVRLICKTIVGMTALILGLPAAQALVNFFF